MRLSEWRSAAPSREALSGKVLAVVEPVLEALGADPDPYCWIAWGDDPAVRYMIYVPTAAGLISCHVRLALPGEGPRASAKVVRWHRVQLGELAIETVGGHRLVSFQVEQQVLRGADRQADDIAAFGRVLFAAVDGRPIPDLGGRRRRRTAGKAAGKGAVKGRAAQPAAKRKTTAGGAERRRTSASPAAAATAEPAQARDEEPLPAAAGTGAPTG